MDGFDWKFSLLGKDMNRPIRIRMKIRERVRYFIYYSKEGKYFVRVL